MSMCAFYHACVSAFLHTRLGGRVCLAVFTHVHVLTNRTPSDGMYGPRLDLGAPVGSVGVVKWRGDAVC